MPGMNAGSIQLSNAQITKSGSAGGLSVESQTTAMTAPRLPILIQTVGMLKQCYWKGKEMDAMGAIVLLKIQMMLHDQWKAVQTE